MSVKIKALLNFKFICAWTNVVCFSNTFYIWGVTEDFNIYSPNVYI
jgi:hypothetical protein